MYGRTYAEKYGRKLTDLQIRIVDKIHDNPEITIRELADIRKYARNRQEYAEDA